MVQTNVRKTSQKDGVLKGLAGHVCVRGGGVGWGGGRHMSSLL